jgi:hypothetical protein
MAFLWICSMVTWKEHILWFCWVKKSVRYYWWCWVLPGWFSSSCSVNCLGRVLKLPTVIMDLCMFISVLSDLVHIFCSCFVLHLQVGLLCPLCLEVTSDINIITSPSPSSLSLSLSLSLPPPLWSCYVVWDYFELLILLLQPLECWDYIMCTIKPVSAFS